MILTDEQHLTSALPEHETPSRRPALVVHLLSKKRQLQRTTRQLHCGKTEAIYQCVEDAIDEEHIVDHVGCVGAGHAPERVPRVAVLDGGLAGKEEDGGEVIGEDDAGERSGDLGEAELLASEEMKEQEPRGVVGGRGCGGDEVALRVEEGAAGGGQVMAPGEAKAVKPAEREVE